MHEPPEHIFPDAQSESIEQGTQAPLEHSALSHSEPDEHSGDEEEFSGGIEQSVIFIVLLATL